MNVAFKNDDNRSGYGWFVITDIANPVDGEWQISLLNSEAGYATGDLNSPFIMKETPYFFRVQGEKTGENSLRLQVGPAFVDYLDDQVNYKFELKYPDGSDCGSPVSVLIGDVARSSDKYLVQKDDYRYEPAAPAPEQRDSIFGAGEKESARPDEDDSPKLDIMEPDETIETPLVPGGQAEEAAGEPLNEEVAGGENEPADNGEAEASPLDNIEMPPRNSRSRLWIMLGAIIALLAIIGVLIWLYYGPQADSGEKSAAKQEAAIEEQVKAFMGRPDKSGQLAVDLAKKLKPANTAEQDAIYRLYYFAANNGDPVGKFKYAEILDPSRPQWGSIQKDGAIAWDMYGQAAADNVKEAAAARENLEKWLVEEAEKGNANARTWLNGIRK